MIKLTKPTAVLSLILVCAIWGFGFVVTKDSLSSVGANTFLFFRFAFAGVFLLVLPKKIGFRKVSAQGLVLGLFFGAGYVFQTLGLTGTSSSNSALITGLHAILVPFCAYFVIKESIGVTKIIGIIVALIGLYLLTAANSAEQLTADFLTILCALFFAVHVVFTNKFARTKELNQILFSQILAITLICIPLVSLSEDWGIAFSTVIQNLPHYLFTGVLGTVLALFLMIKVQKVLNATETALIFLLEPVFGVIFGHIFEENQFTTFQAIGAVLLVLSMLIVSVNHKRLLGNLLK